MLPCYFLLRHNFSSIWLYIFKRASKINILLSFCLFCLFDIQGILLVLHSEITSGGGGQGIIWVAENWALAICMVLSFWSLTAFTLIFPRILALGERGLPTCVWKVLEMLGPWRTRNLLLDHSVGTQGLPGLHLAIIREPCDARDWSRVDCKTSFASPM